MKASSPREPGPAASTPGHEMTSSVICRLAVRASVIVAPVGRTWTFEPRYKLK